MVDDVTIVNSGRDSINSRVLKLAKELSKGDYEVNVLTWDRNRDYPKRETIDDIHISNFRFKTYTKNKYLLPLFYMFWWGYIVYFLFIKEPDKVQVMNLYNIVPLVVIKAIADWELVYDIGDSAAHSFQWPTPIMKVLIILENYCIKLSDGVMNVDPHRKELVTIPEETPSTIVMNSVEDNYEEIKEAPLDKTSHEDKFVIYYGGWITETRGIYSLVEAIGDLENTILIIAGPEPDDDILELLQDSEDIFYQGLVSNQRSLEFTYTADIVYAYYDPVIPINRLASPNKLFEAMMCATPIMSNQEAIPVKKIIQESNCGMITEYGDVSQVQDVLKELISQPSYRNHLGENGRRAYLDRYSWDIMGERLRRFYDVL